MSMQEISISDQPKDETSQATPTIEPPPGEATERDLQRAALGDLVVLSTQCGAEQSELERVRQAALDIAARDLKKANWAVEQKFAELREAHAKDETARAGKIASAYNTEKATLINSDKARRQRIDAERQAVEKEVKAALEKAEWLADSVLEGAQMQAAEVFKKAKVRVGNHLQDIADLEKRTLELMARYSVEIPGAKVVPIVKKKEDGEEETTLPSPKSISDSKGPKPEEAEKQYEIDKTAAAEGIQRLAKMSLANFMTGLTPFAVGFVICVVAAAGMQSLYGLSNIQPMPDGAAAGGALVLVLASAVFMKITAKKQVLAAYAPVRESLDAARRDADAELVHAVHLREQAIASAETKRKIELQVAKDGLLPKITEATKKRDAQRTAIAAESNRLLARLEATKARNAKDHTAWSQGATETVELKYASETAAIAEANAAKVKAAEDAYAAGRAALEKKWADGLAKIAEPIGDEGQASHAWDDPYWDSWKPSRTFAQAVRFGEMRIDPKQVIAELPNAEQFNLPLPDKFTMPANLAFPRHASLLLQADRNGRAEAIRTLQMVMSRLLTTIPPGRVKFTILDPVGLGQNFAGFMHLADYDETLVGSRIWTDADQIDQKLSGLTEHMETVIQKYLRNEYETIDEYNLQAGELSEPYRFLVIADFPVNFSDDAYRRLSSIATTGARCGVYTLVFRDIRQTMQAGAHLEDLVAHSVNLLWGNNQWVWQDEVFKRFPLVLDAPPSEEQVTKILHVVGPAAKESNRVEVNFDSIAPKPNEFWKGSTQRELTVPIGRSGATRLQSLRLGRGVAQHVLIAGKTGSGKSTLLHAMITNAAMWFSPAEVEMYLIDFKKGVEFKTYASHGLPHARAIAVESDREFGLSVLQKIDAEMTRRGDIFRKIGVQDLGSYRDTSNPQIMPRTLLIIDEFQEFFSEDDKLSQEASLLLDRLVRQGRAFGIHVLLGSQTIGGTSGLSRSTIGQMGVRVALQTSEADSQLILGDGNSAARLLSRPGEAIYNDAGGLVEANSPFQVAYLDDDRKEQFLAEITRRVNGKPLFDPPLVFEGNASADINKNQKLAKLIDQEGWPKPPLFPLAWLGDPVAIKDPTAVSFRRQSGANMLIIGQSDENAMAILATSIVGLAAQYPPGGASFYVLDGSAVDSPMAGVFAQVKAALPHDVKLFTLRQTPAAINEIAESLEKRRDGEASDAAPIFLVIFDIKRYRELRKTEDSSFGFGSSSDEPVKAAPDKQFAEIYKEGPSVGIHALVWVDSMVSIDRAFDRNAMREFDNRVLFQMSASDSSNLIDSPAANKLGQHRALWYSEEQGVMEKFRPYSLPPADWLAQIHGKWASRPASEPRPAPDAAKA
jgi:DNA segregation ATPase FtsK/SpoIIIE, S-DNA-T family